MQRLNELQFPIPINWKKSVHNAGQEVAETRSCKSIRINHTLNFSTPPAESETGYIETASQQRGISGGAQQLSEINGVLFFRVSDRNLRPRALECRSRLFVLLTGFLIAMAPFVIDDFERGILDVL